MITVFSNTHHTYSPKGMVHGYELRRPRPMIEALERAAEWLRMDYIGGMLFTAREYGLRGMVVQLRRDGRRGFDALDAIANDLRDIPALMFARLIGLRGWRYLISGMLSTGCIAANEGLLRAYEDLHKLIDPAYAAQTEQWAAERKAKQAAEDDAYLDEYRARPHEPFHATVLINLWAAMSTEARQQAALYMVAEACGAGDLAEHEADAYAVQFWHALGNTDAVVEFITTEHDDEISARRLFADWRAQQGEMQWLADHYEPLVMARIKPAQTDGSDNDITYTDTIEAA
jgi:hypothetical protein